MVTLADFNAAAPDRAASVLRPCLDVDRWIAEVVAGRPYADTDALTATAAAAADPLSAAEVESALAHHPRIGERAAGESAEAGLSRGEQAGLDTGGDVPRRLREGNAAYERRFGRVFLIRAAGRSSEEILAELDRRLGNDDETEAAETAEQLRQIALVRLQGAVGGGPDDGPPAPDQRTDQRTDPR
ncbi:2-oxo-4-hydroxy-4-carboxy-5-ureidoimidazoline decarboxylase [Friedmanniella endophytica]|uniref:2-oxo-4-hydroxy-4-carboxy-5-ureidoimidazoline decarboxylase n=1 Tax=Microlunatus kandeliicorticis TaxID=1759536 RepID=A0A7W3IUH0_9ACTN|nr:2-oxo-4-hydroxy-4-carboxy-5-ureidoimidazoline decarboxylase [Microlunatus kandeliicorticis]MBA8795488.1 2-oxo-4-hydroxy-4-carboxy-5-ureidoimidazoline decarboxylase [Microlunatus kandeliicorticis]